MRDLHRLYLGRWWKRKEEQAVQGAEKCNPIVKRISLFSV
jgi:hypothetical protein